MRQDTNDRRRFAERSVEGRDDRGELEVVTIWIDRDHALWRVCRAVNVRQRTSADPRPEDIVFEGYEMGDALEAANAALDGDLAASADNDDHNDDVQPFAEAELQKKLERWFFDHA